MRSFRFLAVAALASLAHAPAMADPIITTNLSNGAVIVPINGAEYGASVYGGTTPPGVIGTNQDDWYKPYTGDGGPLLTYTIQPGTYTFQIIDSTDAAAMFPSLTTAQLATIGGGAWTYNSPWITDYLVYDSSAATNPNEHQLFSGAVTPGSPVPGSSGWDGAGYSNAADAYQAAKLGGYYDQVVTGGGRYTGTAQASYTFSSAETLIFAIPDQDVSDNNGTVSVLITPASVPEPSSLVLTLCGFLVLMALTTQRRGVARPVSLGRD